MKIKFNSVLWIDLNWRFASPTHTQTRQFYTVHTGQPVLAGTRSEQLKKFVTAKFYSPYAFAASS